MNLILDNHSHLICCYKNCICPLHFGDVHYCWHENILHPKNCTLSILLQSRNYDKLLINNGAPSNYLKKSSCIAHHDSRILHCRVVGSQICTWVLEPLIHFLVFFLDIYLVRALILAPNMIAASFHLESSILIMSNHWISFWECNKPQFSQEGQHQLLPYDPLLTWYL